MIHWTQSAMEWIEEHLMKSRRSLADANVAMAGGNYPGCADPWSPRGLGPGQTG
jgi:hypothetical protein